VLPRALEGLSVAERGRARRLQAECMLANAGAAPRAAVADAVVDVLRDAVDACTTADDRRGLRDCWYLLARVHHQVGDRTARATACAAYRAQVTALAQAEAVFAA
jgi:hypothetical protein